MGRARRRRERVQGHLTELRRLHLGGGPDPAFRERLRTELVTAAPGADEPDQAPARRRPERRRRPLFSQLATAGLAAGMMISAFATYQSVPGDTLYPLKRAAESTLVRLSTDEAERGERELDSAKARADEVAKLLGASNGGPLVSKTLKDMEQSTRSGINRLERVKPRSPKIKKFAEDQREKVEPMLDQLDEAQQGQAAGYLDYIQGLVAPPE
ncbi:hypothetical protein HII36_06130 [Nonomuraea sp. NN258]|uniref:DUF5667 domain-containing protein n=1 Tax=Nonomuraea antri TaxID=2730852 RepID=UPI001569DF84|nr:DUF5667 domain-containing protein [Nonomuraea antri]NRQ31418.1 hypothetical protein [Nonomuraea antri]